MIICVLGHAPSYIALFLRLFPNFDFRILKYFLILTTTFWPENAAALGRSTPFLGLKPIRPISVLCCTAFSSGFFLSPSHGDRVLGKDFVWRNQSRTREFGLNDENSVEWILVHRRKAGKPVNRCIG